MKCVVVSTILDFQTGSRQLTHYEGEMCGFLWVNGVAQIQSLEDLSDAHKAYLRRCRFLIYAIDEETGGIQDQHDGREIDQWLIEEEEESGNETDETLPDGITIRNPKKTKRKR